jgi:hypothetical protein
MLVLRLAKKLGGEMSEPSGRELVEANYRRLEAELAAALQARNDECRLRQGAERRYAELLTNGGVAAERIRELEAALADMTADYHRWHDAYMTLKYPDGGSRTTAETPAHLKGPIIQAHADTHGVPPQSETGAKFTAESREALCTHCGKTFYQHSNYDASCVTSSKSCSDARPRGQEDPGERTHPKAPVQIGTERSVTGRQAADSPSTSKAETPAEPEPNFLFDTGADFCDRHETAFKIGERCPKCAQSDRGGKHGS